jgi:GNAT superfamily N-acetyltransferase
MKLISLDNRRIRLASIGDIDTLTMLARIVANDLHLHGIDQWDASYPSQEHFIKDLNRQGLYVADIDGVIVGSVTIIPEDDPFYHEISWDCQKSYVLHRLMVHPKWMRQGIGRQLFLSAIDVAKKANQDSIKVDTHPDNYRMQSLIISLGFVKRGYIKSMHRIGFELVLNHESNKGVDLNVHR